MIGLEVFAGIMAGGGFYVVCLVTAFRAADRCSSAAVGACVATIGGCLFPIAAIVGVIVAVAAS